jgi:hypothetical protein
MDRISEQHDLASSPHGVFITVAEHSHAAKVVVDRCRHCDHEIKVAMGRPTSTECAEMVLW